MPSGQTSTLLNRKPIYVGDDTSLNSVSFPASTSGAPTVRGYNRQVITPAGVATTLTAAQSGSLVLWDAAAGFIFTLPAPAIGLWFEFEVTVTATSANHKVITDAGTTFILGAVHAIAIATTPSSTAGPFGFSFNGSSHIAVLMNGTTTGAVIGTRIRLDCISATIWAVSGLVIGSGNLATPASTT